MAAAAAAAAVAGGGVIEVTHTCIYAEMSLLLIAGQPADRPRAEVYPDCATQPGRQQLLALSLKGYSALTHIHVLHQQAQPHSLTLEGGQALLQQRQLVLHVACAGHITPQMVQQVAGTAALWVSPVGVQQAKHHHQQTRMQGVFLGGYRMAVR